jgi:hypothetical protein
MIQTWWKCALLRFMAKSSQWSGGEVFELCSGASLQLDCNFKGLDCKTILQGHVDVNGFSRCTQTSDDWVAIESADLNFGNV